MGLPKGPSPAICPSCAPSQESRSKRQAVALCMGLKPKFWLSNCARSIVPDTSPHRPLVGLQIWNESWHTSSPKRFVAMKRSTWKSGSHTRRVA